MILHSYIGYIAIQIIDLHFNKMTNIFYHDDPCIELNAAWELNKIVTLNLRKVHNKQAIWNLQGLFFTSGNQLD